MRDKGTCCYTCCQNSTAPACMKESWYGKMRRTHRTTAMPTEHTHNAKLANYNDATTRTLQLATPQALEAPELYTDATAQSRNHDS